MFRSIAAVAVLLGTGAAVAEDVSYSVGDESFTGYVARAESPKGLVLIVHDWDGMTDYERRRADMLAGLGYDAFALDMFGQDTPTETVEHRQAATGALYKDRDRMRQLIEAGLAQARQASDADGLVVIGYCFGGAVALEMARSDRAQEAQGYATFHGGLSTPEGQSYSAETPPLMIYHGGADDSITVQDVAELQSRLERAGTTYTLEIFSGAPHAFTVFDSDSYQDRADAASWEDFTEFLSLRLDG